jgi:SM-20-related protein
MTTRVEHWGTSVVANYGDLLYPLVLEHALARAIPDLELTFADPLGGEAPMGLHHRARRARRHGEPGFWTQVAEVDAVVIGGGDLLHHGTTMVRLDHAVARVENWTFVEAGLLGDVRPVAWNGLGVPYDIPPELAPALRAACAPVQLLTVRDEGSRRRLEAAGVDAPIDVVPDTAVLIDAVVPAAERATAIEARRARGELPPSGPLLVAHVSFASPVVLAELAGALRAGLDAHPDLHLVLLPIGATHGDHEALQAVAAQVDRPSWLVTQPTVVEVTALLAAARVVVSSSYHAALVSTVYGVPSLPFAHYGHRPAKLVDLAVQLERPDWLLDRPSAVPAALDAVLAGGSAVDANVIEALKARATAHLARVAEVVTGPVPAGVDLAERDAAHRHSLDQLATTTAALDQARQELEVLQEHRHAAVERARVLEVAYWRERDRGAARGAVAAGPTRVLDLGVIDRAELRTKPYRWGHVGPLASAADLARLAQTVPLDTAEVRADSDGRRSWSYRVRGLVGMGGRRAVRPHELDPVWRALADDLGGDAYRAALSRLTGVDLTDLDLEVNVFSYPTGGYQEPHPDLPEKVVTHVLWFNEGWEPAHGGCLRILRSRDEQDVDQELLPELGWSAVFVRSDHSWHSVTAVTDDAPVDRRAVVATFHRPGSPSTMWPDGT